LHRDTKILFGLPKVGTVQQHIADPLLTSRHLKLIRFASKSIIHDSYTFLFDNTELRPCPLLHFQASHITLTFQAKLHLGNPIRISSKGITAEQLPVLELHRQPHQHPMHTFPVLNNIVQCWSSTSNTHINWQAHHLRMLPIIRQQRPHAWPDSQFIVFHKCFISDRRY